MVQNPDRDRYHPESGKNQKYPFSHTILTDCGHELILDDTQGSELIRIAHGTAGSYTEMGKDGGVVHMTTGKLSQYVKGGHALAVDGNSNQKVGGSSRSSVQGDTHSETQGKHTSFTGGDSSHIVSGDHTTATAGDSVHGIKGKMVQKIGGGCQLKLDGDDSNQKTANLICDPTGNVQFGKDLGMYVKNDWQANTGGKTTFNSKGAMTANSQSTMTITGKSSVTVSSDGSITINTSGTVSIQGKPVQINGGGGMSIPPFTTKSGTFTG